MDTNVEALEGEIVGKTDIIPSRDLAALEPLPLLQTKKTFEDWFAVLEEEVFAEAPQHDHTTETGREAIRAIAYRVARLKTTIDNKGKLATEEWRRLTKTVNDQRTRIEDKLADLQARLKAPMEKHLADEAARVERVTKVIDALDRVLEFNIGTTTAEMQPRLDWLKALAIEETVFQVEYHKALALRTEAVPKLEKLIADTLRAEADAKELEDLRRERTERQEREAEEKRKKDAADLAVMQAAEAEERRKQEAADAEALRVANEAAAEVAAEEARLAAIARGEEEAAAAAAAAEARKKAEEEQQRQQAEAVAAARALRVQRLAEISAALKAEGDLSDEQTEALMLALEAGSIPHLTMNLTAGS